MFSSFETSASKIEVCLRTWSHKKKFLEPLILRGVLWWNLCIYMYCVSENMTSRNFYSNIQFCVRSTVKNWQQDFFYLKLPLLRLCTKVEKNYNKKFSFFETSASKSEVCLRTWPHKNIFWNLCFYVVYYGGKVDIRKKFFQPLHLRLEFRRNHDIKKNVSSKLLL